MQEEFLNRKVEIHHLLNFQLLEIHNTHPNNKSLKLQNGVCMCVCVLTTCLIWIQTIFNSLFYH